MSYREHDYRLAEQLHCHRQLIRGLFPGANFRPLRRSVPHADLELLPAGQLVECKTDTAKGSDVGPEIVANLRPEAAGIIKPGKVYEPGSPEHSLLIARARAEREWTREYGHGASLAGIAAAYFKEGERYISYVRIARDYKRWFYLDQSKLGSLLIDSGKASAATSLPLYCSELNAGRWFCAGIKIPPAMFEAGGQLAAAVIASREISGEEWRKECGWTFRARGRLAAGRSREAARELGWS